MNPLLVALALLAVCCMAQRAAAQTTGTTVPVAPTDMPSLAPSPVPTPVPTAVPTPAPPPPPAPTPSPAPTAPGLALPYVISPPPPPAGQPVIVQIAFNARSFRPGDGVFMRVLTSPDTTGVAVEAYGQRFPLTSTGPGRFVLSGTVPGIPFFFLNRSYTLDCVATGSSGRTTRVPFQLYLGS